MRPGAPAGGQNSAAGHSSGHRADHRPLCRSGPWLLRWFERNLEKVLPQPPRTSEVSAGRGGAGSRPPGGGLRKDIPTRGVCSHPLPGSWMGGVTAGGRQGIWGEGQASAWLARGPGEGRLCSTPSLPAYDPGLQRRARRRCLGPRYGEGAWEGLSEVVAG